MATYFDWLPRDVALIIWRKAHVLNMEMVHRELLFATGLLHQHTVDHQYEGQLHRMRRWWFGPLNAWEQWHQVKDVRITRDPRSIPRKMHVNRWMVLIK